MTQGTKIGLLVSLAFLIVIFVLLSDHVANTTDAKPAVVTSAGPQVEKAIATPGIAVAPVPEPAQPEMAVAPREQVTTGGEMAAINQGPAISSVKIGPAQTGVSNINVQKAAGAQAGPVQVGPDTRILTFGKSPENTVSDFVPVGAGTQSLASVAPKATEHKGMPGDTVAKWAKTFYGADTKANRDLIIAANKSLKGDPNRIEIGKVYTIPAKPGSPVAVASVAGSATPLAAGGAPAGPSTRPAAATETPVLVVPTASASASAERVYVVKQGDNLWKIAHEQCKDANAVDQIKKLNHDILKNGTDLKVGTKLKLPPVTKEA